MSWTSVARRLAKEGKYHEAIKAAEAMLAIECEVLGRNHRDSAASLYAIARLHTGVGQYAAALKASTELVEVKAALLGAEHWEVADTPRPAQLRRARVEARCQPGAPAC